MVNSLTISALLNILTDEREKELLHHLTGKHYGSNFLTNREELENKFLEMLDKYGELSWAGSLQLEDLENPLTRQKYDQLKERYPRDMEKIEGPEGTWWRGFNTGILACCQLIHPFSLHPNFIGNMNGMELNKEEFIALAEEEFDNVFS